MHEIVVFFDEKVQISAQIDISRPIVLPWLKLELTGLHLSMTIQSASKAAPNATKCSMHFLDMG